MEFLEKGGVVFALILSCSLVAVTIAVQRWRFYRSVEKEETMYITQWQQSFTSGNNRPFGAGEGPLAKLWTAVYKGWSEEQSQEESAFEAVLEKEDAYYTSLAAEDSDLTTFSDGLAEINGNFETSQAALSEMLPDLTALAKLSQTENQAQ